MSDRDLYMCNNSSTMSNCGIYMSNNEVVMCNNEAGMCNSELTQVALKGEMLHGTC